MASRKQIAFVEAFKNQRLNSTIDDVCKSAGVTRTSFYRWRKDKRFIEYLNSNIREEDTINFLRVYLVGLKKALEGEANFWNRIFDHLANVTQVADKADTALHPFMEHVQAASKVMLAAGPPPQEVRDAQRLVDEWEIGVLKKHDPDYFKR